MAKYLSQEWLDLQREIGQEFPGRPGASARMQLVVTGSPEGDVKYYSVIEDGKMTENKLGEDPQAEFTLTTRYEDSVKTVNAELDINAAFMQGKLKVAGSMGKLMALMPLTQTPEYRAIQTKVAQKTEF